ncbi:hypothetical protein GCM10028798_17470 [Humibacter antri]
MNGRDRIDAYLDELFTRLHGDVAECRSMLAEAEAHLRDATAASVQEGIDEDAAQQVAIEAFGSPEHVARSADPHPVAAAVAAFVMAGGGLAVVGFVTIGLSAVIARVVAAFTSTQWVYGAPAGHRFSAAQCAHWLSVQPTAADCSSAAAMENSDDSFQFTIAGVIAGLLVVGIAIGLALFLRRTAPIARRRVPHIVVWAVGATAFGGSGVALLAGGVGDIVVSGLWGQGLWYAEAAIALTVAMYFGARLIAATTRSLGIAVEVR